MNKLLLRVNDLVMHFGGTVALDHVSFDVSRGEIVGIVGPNGAGKTTLLNCISGVYKPQNGKIEFDNTSVLEKKPHEIARLGIARTLQHPQMLRQGLSLAQNVMLGRHLFVKSNFFESSLGLPGSTSEESRNLDRTRDILAFLDLQKHGEVSPTDLPYGLQKTVELARALAMEPKLLLMDEPSSGLSIDEKPKLRDKILEIRNRFALTLMVIEHDLKLISEICDRIIVLDFGKKLADGAPRSVFNDQKVIEAYLGEAV